MCQKKIIAKQNYHKCILCIYKSGYLKSFKVTLNYLQRDMNYFYLYFICIINYIPFGHDKNKNKEYI